MSSMESNAKGEARGTRTDKGSEDLRPSNPGRQEGIGRDSSQHEYLSGGSAGEIGQRQDTHYVATLTGGVIGQLILDAEDRLKVARECIEWYVREEEKELSRLDNLRKLNTLAEQMKHQQPSE
ncbi:hypothetical protein [Microcoleus sp. FACHB-68]|uniref:hypothetical protein n=1 Tax=Microcoleus sp. FACHB-68 TaxID=2692826 RepID=UPI001683706B|nr:hypothetical protein [Microcoleus sp. FACHB-68]MBD1939103.1 hypothetical protein [Microcoleus sp. FACHB-68]